MCRVARVNELAKKRNGTQKVREFRKRFEQRIQAKLQQQHLVIEIPYNGNYNGAVRHEAQAGKTSEAQARPTQG